MHKFQIGDIVYISDVGKTAYKNDSCNPYGVQGRVCEVEPGDWEDHQFCLEVDWDNGYHNSYRPRDLELVNLIVENE